MMQVNDLLQRLRNPAWTENDGQRLVLEPEVTQGDMADAAIWIESLLRRVEALEQVRDIQHRFVIEKRRPFRWFGWWR